MSRRAFSVATFIVNGDDLLLIKHKLLGMWLPVGGEIEPYTSKVDDCINSETPLEAARREVKEETGLDVRYPKLDRRLDGCPPGFIGYDEHAAGSKGLHMNFNFVAFSDSREVKGDGSFSEHKWFPLGGGPINNCDDVPLNVRQCIGRIYFLRKEGRL